MPKLLDQAAHFEGSVERFEVLQITIPIYGTIYVGHLEQFRYWRDDLEPGSRFANDVEQELWRKVSGKKQEFYPTEEIAVGSAFEACIRSPILNAAGFCQDREYGIELDPAAIDGVRKRIMPFGKFNVWRDKDLRVPEVGLVTLKAQIDHIADHIDGAYPTSMLTSAFWLQL